MVRLKVLFGQVLTLGVVLGGIYHGHLDPRILSFAFMLLALARLVTVQGMVHLSTTGDEDAVAILQSKFFRPPPRGVPPPYYTYGDSGRPVGLGAHLLVLGAVFFCAFVFLHLGERQKLVFSFPAFIEEMGWALVIVLVYWLSDLITRDMVFDRERPAVDNLAYNHGSLTLLAVAVLLSAVLIVIFQSQSRAPHPWLFYGPVLALVHLAALRRGLRDVE